MKKAGYFILFIIILIGISFFCVFAYNGFKLPSDDYFLNSINYKKMITKLEEYDNSIEVIPLESDARKFFLRNKNLNGVSYLTNNYFTSWNMNDLMKKIGNELILAYKINTFLYPILKEDLYDIIPFDFKLRLELYLIATEDLIKQSMLEVLSKEDAKTYLKQCESTSFQITIVVDKTTDIERYKTIQFDLEEYFNGIVKNNSNVNIPYTLVFDHDLFQQEEYLFNVFCMDMQGKSCYYQMPNGERFEINKDAVIINRIN